MKMTFLVLSFAFSSALFAQVDGPGNSEFQLAATTGDLECWVNAEDGVHTDFSEDSKTFDSGKPFGLVKVEKNDGRYHLSYIENGEETITSFKKEISITKQGPKGFAGPIGNIVCN